MKKLLFLILCTTTLGLVSCKKDTIINETPNRTFIYTIQPNSWTLNSAKDTYTTILDINEIDGVTMDDEGILIYITDPNNPNVQRQLPFVYNLDTYSYEFKTGEIKIHIQSPDAQDTEPFAPTKPITAKVIIIPSTFQP
ncbi:hypothetical protein [Pedobacter panaciterrae]|uniref:DUF4843 domain-containing protein n=1 Tax=Pedobacter panaciterrae TaxID=363849 RepID=A0ABU8NIG5_9SPHI|nr:hypothetical protein [uncultured Pedobacter sp.]